ncbi:hypothetical protein KB681_gp09 [Burkholderia phage Mica]|uniref:Uncharacterized protein n=1 Tax=Burkholderia phage Mica TaxID=2767579 RepID=A0A873WI23_9CAUD|nr:hypothetical protein KB681_gp09 [Burkholderia phage Mica]QPB08622.1 hypothetical protein CPT_Mica_009 [Burkholderia phage Mica]
MDANTDVDLDALHDAIVADIKAQFPDLQTVEFYRTEERKGGLEGLPLPAVILNLSEFEPDMEIDPGTQQLAVHARFEAEIIFGFRTPNVKRAIRKFSAAFAAWLRLRRWNGVRTGPAYVVSCGRSDFNPELDQYEVWCVEWTQPVHLGNTIWTNDGTVPTEVLAGWSPKIGTGHEADYDKVES